jgi:hypothetical protein
VGFRCPGTGRLRKPIRIITLRKIRISRLREQLAQALIRKYPKRTGGACQNARTTNLNLVWDDNRSEIRAIFLTPGTAITINAKKMHHEEEDD